LDCFGEARPPIAPATALTEAREWPIFDILNQRVAALARRFLTAYAKRRRWSQSYLCLWPWPFESPSESPLPFEFPLPSESQFEVQFEFPCVSRPELPLPFELPLPLPFEVPPELPCDALPEPAGLGAAALMLPKRPSFPWFGPALK
jgi:hypothetical protein